MYKRQVYELSGDTAWSFPELAATVAEVAGRPVAYQDLTAEQYRAALVEAGLPEAIAQLLAAFDTDAANGLLADTPGDLSALLGRPTTPLADTVAEILKG